MNTNDFAKLLALAEPTKDKPPVLLGNIAVLHTGREITGIHATNFEVNVLSGDGDPVYFDHRELLQISRRYKKDGVVYFDSDGIVFESGKKKTYIPGIYGDDLKHEYPGRPPRNDGHKLGMFVIEADLFKRAMDALIQVIAQDASRPILENAIIEVKPGTGQQCDVLQMWGTNGYALELMWLPVSASDEEVGPFCIDGKALHNVSKHLTGDVTGWFTDTNMILECGDTVYSLRRNNSDSQWKIPDYTRFVLPIFGGPEMRVTVSELSEAITSVGYAAVHAKSQYDKVAWFTLQWLKEHGAKVHARSRTGTIQEYKLETRGIKGKEVATLNYSFMEPAIRKAKKLLGENALLSIQPDPTNEGAYQFSLANTNPDVEHFVLTVMKIG